MAGPSFARDNMTLMEKLGAVSWFFLALVTLVASVGFMSLYSAAGGDMEPWAGKQMIRFAIGMIGLLIVALVDIRLWMRGAYWFYGVVVLLLLYVEIMGYIGMGAQRWINLGFMHLQPSELMKIAVILALARYFNGLTAEEIRNPLRLLPALGIVGLPVGLVVIQPDLGTALMITFCSIALFFVAGVSYWLFIAGGMAVAGALPLLWTLMHDYQKKRVMTFLNPESDPLGAGYHITQSKIALGSGGIAGKGFLQGTQSSLNFLPEKQTDFIFTLFAEEWGLIGSLALLGLFAMIIFYGYIIAFHAQNHFSRLLAAGVMINFSLYIFINIGMVMGLLPVVGIPLALISHGGSSMLAVLFGFGLLMSVHVHRYVKFTRRGIDMF